MSLFERPPVVKKLKPDEILIGGLYAIGFRLVLNRLQKAVLHLEHAPNNYLLQRISGPPSIA